MLCRIPKMKESILIPKNVRSFFEINQFLSNPAVRTCKIFYSLISAIQAVTYIHRRLNVMMLHRLDQSTVMFFSEGR